MDHAGVELHPPCSDAVASEWSFSDNGWSSSDDADALDNEMFSDDSASSGEEETSCDSGLTTEGDPMKSSTRYISTTAKRHLTESPMMGESSWGVLPMELMIRIVSRLPLSSFLRLRSVCKGWNRLTFDVSFQKMWADRPKLPPFCLAQSSAGLYVSYNSATDVWTSLSPSFFSLKCDGTAYMLCNSGGFVLLAGRARTLYVSNPVNRSERRLPPFPFVDPTEEEFYATIAVDRMTNDYKVLVVGRPSAFSMGDPMDYWQYGSFDEWLVSVVYDSRKGSWTRVGTVPEACAHDNIKISSSLHNNVHYCLLHVNLRVHVFRIVSEGCTKRQECWDELQFGFPKDFQYGTEFAELYDSRTGLILVAKSRKTFDTWEFHFKGHKLLETVRKDIVGTVPSVHLRMALFAGRGDTVFIAFEMDKGRPQFADGPFVRILMGQSPHGYRYLPMHPTEKGQVWDIALFEPRLDLVA